MNARPIVALVMTVIAAHAGRADSLPSTEILGGAQDHEERLQADFIDAVEACWFADFQAGPVLLRDCLDDASLGILDDCWTYFQECAVRVEIGAGWSGNPLPSVGEALSARTLTLSLPLPFNPVVGSPAASTALWQGHVNACLSLNPDPKC